MYKVRVKCLLQTECYVNRQLISDLPKILQTGETILVISEFTNGLFIVGTCEKCNPKVFYFTHFSDDCDFSLVSSFFLL